MTTYRIYHRQIRQAPTLTAMLQSLERGFMKFGVDYYLIGAVARDVWMGGIFSMPPRRTTTDIDFAVGLPNHISYDSLKQYLVAHENFHPVKENQYVLIWRDAIEVDLLPFDRLDYAQRGDYQVQTMLPGLPEVYEEALVSLALDDGHQFKTCTLPALVVLKLIAYDDRPEIRQDDIKDITDILEHFFELHSHLIWDQHADLFTNDAALIDIAARVLGREIAQIIRKNQPLHRRISEIIERHMILSTNSPLVKLMTEMNGQTLQANATRLKHIQQGLNET
jgi:predicted nucleotidyltransferase